MNNFIIGDVILEPWGVDKEEAKVVVGLVWVLDLNQYTSEQAVHPELATTWIEATRTNFLAIVSNRCRGRQRLK